MVVSLLLFDGHSTLHLPNPLLFFIFMKIRNEYLLLFLMPILGQVRLSIGQLCPAVLVKILGQSPEGLEPPAGAINRKKHSLKLFFHNPRSTIKLESAHDPNFLYAKFSSMLFQPDSNHIHPTYYIFNNFLRKKKDISNLIFGT